MASYYIFKTNNATGTTTHICNGGYDTEKECFRHFRVYSFGFMDAAAQLAGPGRWQMETGTYAHSFRLTTADGVDCEYFMLLGDDGQALIQELGKL